MTTSAIDTSMYTVVQEAVRKEAARILGDGTVSAVVGYCAGRRKGSCVPVVVTEPAQAERLVFTAACVNNLALYLTKAKKEVPKAGKVGIVVKGCDMKALVGLMSESQLKREDLYLVAVPCSGVLGSVSRPAEALDLDNVAAKCLDCDVRVPRGADFLPEVKLPAFPEAVSRYEAEIARLEAMSPRERWAYWKEQLSKCVKCMACRQVCPFCYCERCLCDRNRPQMVDSTPRPAGNMAWHIARAMHLAGRCAGCGECERVCPMDIPLNLLNRKMAKELEDLYGYVAGTEVRESGPLNSFTEKDDQSFIK
jgi:formate dehydrogenase (coenzyme F420) beta subunit